MAQRSEKVRADFALMQLLPNMLTVAAICAGMTAIRLGVVGNYIFAVQLILIAAILDGLDGRLARALNSDGKMGAELDSLADFLNFGVAPALVLYFWQLDNLRGLGWIAALVFAVCCVVRLARFNVAAKENDGNGDGAYFTGVPSPAGALLVMLPLYVSFAFGSDYQLPPLPLAIFVIVIGWSLISRVPTWSFKKTRIARDKVKFLLVGFAFVAASLLAFPWESLIVLCAAYVVAVSVSLPRSGRRRRGADKTEEA